VSEPTARKWARRYREEGEAGLLDRPSAAHRVHNRTTEERVEAICALRRLRLTGAEITELLRMPAKTVQGILARVGMGRLGRLGLEPPRRYERSRPGELIHIDVKKLGRIGPNGAGHRVTGKRKSNRGRTDKAGRVRRSVGWEYVHVCVDDATRLAYAEVLGDEKGRTAVGSRAGRLPSSSATEFAWKGCSPTTAGPIAPPCTRSPVRRSACATCAPVPPAPDQRKGREIHPHDAGGWAYGAIYGSSAERAAALDGWLWRYNCRRPHGSLAGKTPAARLAELNNALGAYS
jgi:transposase InsO family protein